MQTIELALNGDNGVVVCALPNGAFRVKLNTAQKIVAHVAGKLKLECAKILVGQHVLVRRTSGDSAIGRIEHVYSI